MKKPQTEEKKHGFASMIGAVLFLGCSAFFCFWGGVFLAESMMKSNDILCGLLWVPSLLTAFVLGAAGLNLGDGLPKGLPMAARCAPAVGFVGGVLISVFL